MLDYYNGLALALNPDDACARRIANRPPETHQKECQASDSGCVFQRGTVREQSGRKPHDCHDECV